MSDYGDKLTGRDVQALIARATTPSPGPALAALKTLQEAVGAGEAAFADQDTFIAAQRAVENRDVNDAPSATVGKGEIRG